MARCIQFMKLEVRRVGRTETRLERWSTIYPALACMTFGIDPVFGQRFAHVLIQQLCSGCFRSVIGLSRNYVLECGVSLQCGHNALTWELLTTDQPDSRTSYPSFETREVGSYTIKSFSVCALKRFVSPVSVLLRIYLTSL